MKKLLSCLILVVTLFTTTISNSYSAFFSSNKNTCNDTVTLSQSQLEEIKNKLDSLERQLNPTTKEKILSFLKQTTKNVQYYGILVVIFTLVAKELGYIKIPETLEELKAAKLDKNIGAYGFTGFLGGLFFGALGNLFGITDLGFLVGPVTVGVLSLYKTDEDPITQTLNNIDMATNVATTVNNATNKLSNAYKWICSWF